MTKYEALEAMKAGKKIVFKDEGYTESMVEIRDGAICFCDDRTHKVYPSATLKEDEGHFLLRAIDGWEIVKEEFEPKFIRFELENE